MAKIVMKFGGTSVADTDRILHVANIVKKKYEENNQITVEVVSQEKYNEWVAMAKKKYAMYPSNNNLVVENKK
jgi:aspartate kinase